MKITEGVWGLPKQRGLLSPLLTCSPWKGQVSSRRHTPCLMRGPGGCGGRISWREGLSQPKSPFTLNRRGKTRAGSPRFPEKAGPGSPRTALWLGAKPGCSGPGHWGTRTCWHAGAGAEPTPGECVTAHRKLTKSHRCSPPYLPPL